MLKSGALILSALLVLAADASAQRLPLRHYGVPDGLPHLTVKVLFQDSRGYLWIGTPDGLARYDGSTFLAYGRDDGLPSTAINNFFEDGAGRLWIATNGGGVVRLLERPSKGPAAEARSIRRFESFTVASHQMANRVNAVAVDDAGNVWTVTDAGVYRGRRADAAAFQFEQVRAGGLADWSHAVAVSDGHFWLANVKEVLEVFAGRLIEHGSLAAAGGDRVGITAMAPAPGGAVFVATPAAVVVVQPADGAGPSTPRPLPIPFFPGEWVTALASSADTLWIGTSSGLIRWHAGIAQRFGATHGIRPVLGLALDREGHLWIGSDAGLDMLVTDSSALFTLANKGHESAALNIVQDRSGRVYAGTWSGVARLDQGAIEWLPASSPEEFGRIAGRLQQDAGGDWWVATDDRLWWIPGPELRFAAARAVSAAHGFADQASVLRVLPGAGRTVLVSSGNPDALYECTSQGGPRCRLRLANAEAVLGAADAGGRMWLARYGPLAVLDGNGVHTVPAGAGLPDGNARAVFVDRQGRLWIGLRHHGVSVAADPSAADPAFRNYSVSEGLSSNFVRDIVQGLDGTIYLATDRGVDRLDPQTDRITHLGTELGFDDSSVADLHVDREGRLWASQASGVMRVAVRERTAPPQPQGPYLTRVAVRGEDRLAETIGITSLGGLELGPNENDVQIEYVAITFAGAPLRYQYRLEPVQAAWSEALRDRAVHFARLPAGNYRFVVRALGADGLVLPREAEARFRIAPAVWRTWWFMGLAALVVAGATFSWHRARLRRLLALARTRQQIAMDLHDDIGAGLVEVAILGELARREGQPSTAAPLARVTDLARSMRESMADIVWAIDPERDQLVDVIQRLRETAFNLAGTARGPLRFNAPAEADLARVTLTPDRRRGLLLIFKEALANIVRHAGDCRIGIDISIAGRRLRLRIEDDGCGFDASTGREGNGLRNLARRASALGAALEIDSRPGHGTTVTLDLPLDRPPIWVVGRQRPDR